MPIRLPAARVLRPDGSLSPGAVVIEGSRIVSVESLLRHEAGDVPDRTIAPGLVDLQVNGLGSIDVATADEAGLADLGAELARRGTTAWCPTLVSRRLDWYAGWFDRHPTPAPGDVGIHLEGPFISRAGAHDTTVLGPPDLPWLAALPDRVKVVTLAPELPRGFDAVALLVERGIVASLGHTEATFDDAEVAAEAGAGMVTHVFNAMRPMHHRDPGVAGAALTDGRLVPAVIGDGIHVHPAILGLILASGPAALVSDSVAAGGLDVSTGAARLADGTLAGSIITLADAVRVAVAAGVPLGPALLAASTTPARVLGLGARGTLEAGARADVIALDGDLNIETVWVEGVPQV